MKQPVETALRVSAGQGQTVLALDDGSQQGDPTLSRGSLPAGPDSLVFRESAITGSGSKVAGNRGDEYSAAQPEDHGFLPSAAMSEVATRDIDQQIPLASLLGSTLARWKAVSVRMRVAWNHEL